MKYTGVTLRPDPNATDLEKLKGSPLGEILATLEQVRDVRDALRSAKADAEKAFEYLTRHIVPEALEEAGLVGADGRGSASTPSGGKVFLQHDLHVSLAAGDRQEAYQSLVDMGLEELVQEYVFPQQLKSLIKDLQEEGAPLPAKVKVEPFTKAVLRR